MELEFKIRTVNNKTLADLVSSKKIVRSTDEVLDLMADVQYHGASMLIVGEHNLDVNFFDLKTGMAAEILQKFSTYQMQLAIVGDFSKYTSKSLHDFIYESNKHGRVLFVSSVKDAEERLVGKI